MSVPRVQSINQILVEIFQCGKVTLTSMDLSIESWLELNILYIIYIATAVRLTDSKTTGWEEGFRYCVVSIRRGSRTLEDI